MTRLKWLSSTAPIIARQAGPPRDVRVRQPPASGRLIVPGRPGLLSSVSLHRFLLLSVRAPGGVRQTGGEPDSGSPPEMSVVRICARARSRRARACPPPARPPGASGAVARPPGGGSSRPSKNRVTAACATSAPPYGMGTFPGVPGCHFQLGCPGGPALGACPGPGRCPQRHGPGRVVAGIGTVPARAAGPRSGKEGGSRDR
jgi:hypothetical protein